MDLLPSIHVICYIALVDDEGRNCDVGLIVLAGKNLVYSLDRLSCHLLRRLSCCCYKSTALRDVLLAFRRTATIVLGISFLMAFMVYPKYWPFVLMGGAGATGVGALIFYLKRKLASGEAGSGSGFRGARILAWLDPYSYESDKAYQSLQALYAIGSGGLFGKGLGNSIQKLGRIPEPYNDMIFSIICEELGIFGAGLIILMFIYLLYRLYSVAQEAEDVFGRLLAIGVFSHVALQVVLNLMVVTSLFPTTGVTLPFFSYGGTASVFLLFEIGMVLNVEKQSRFKKEKELREAREHERAYEGY